jgi:hypothetical protein
MRGCGGVRCEALSSGTLRLGPATLMSAVPLVRETPARTPNGAIA